MASATSGYGQSGFIKIVYIGSSGSGLPFGLSPGFPGGLPPGFSPGLFSGYGMSSLSAHPSFLSGQQPQQSVLNATLQQGSTQASQVAHLTLSNLNVHNTQQTAVASVQKPKVDDDMESEETMSVDSWKDRLISEREAVLEQAKAATHPILEQTKAEIFEDHAESGLHVTPSKIKEERKRSSSSAGFETSSATRSPTQESEKPHGEHCICHLWAFQKR